MELLFWVTSFIHEQIGNVGSQKSVSCHNILKMLIFIIFILLCLIILTLFILFVLCKAQNYKKINNYYMNKHYLY